MDCTVHLLQELGLLDEGGEEVVELFASLEDLQLSLSQQARCVAHPVDSGTPGRGEADCELVDSLVQLQLGRELVGLKVEEDESDAVGYLPDYEVSVLFVVEALVVDLI